MRQVICMALPSRVGELGGANCNGLGCGTVFEISPAGQEPVLHAFSGPPDDGANPSGSGLVMDAEGNLYGTTYEGGVSNY